MDFLKMSTLSFFRLEQKLSKQAPILFFNLFLDIHIET